MDSLLKVGLEVTQPVVEPFELRKKILVPEAFTVQVEVEIKEVEVVVRNPAFK